VPRVVKRKMNFLSRVYYDDMCVLVCAIKQKTETIVLRYYLKVESMILKPIRVTYKIKLGLLGSK
jgi:hypothetical protein